MYLRRSSKPLIYLAPLRRRIARSCRFSDVPTHKTLRSNDALTYPGRKKKFHDETSDGSSANGVARPQEIGRRQLGMPTAKTPAFGYKRNLSFAANGINAHLATVNRE
jgi:hypothetical protein